MALIYKRYIDRVIFYTYMKIIRVFFRIFCEYYSTPGYIYREREEQKIIATRDIYIMNKRLDDKLQCIISGLLPQPVSNTISSGGYKYDVVTNGVPLNKEITS
ncbi:hypothetical protein ACF0H5_020754 [Mactra antiquata]